MFKIFFARNRPPRREPSHQGQPLGRRWKLFLSRMMPRRMLKNRLFPCRLTLQTDLALRLPGCLWDSRSFANLLRVVGLLVITSSCRSLPRLPPVDLKAPGWTVRQGQAIWRQSGSSPEIAAEVLLATRENGDSFIQVTKTPFPLVVAQTISGKWQIEMPVQNKRYAGNGNPPKRLIWFYLPRLLSGEPPPKGWSWRNPEQTSWRLENESSGESIEGYFTK